MTIDDVRIFADVTTRRAEEAFRKQMEESDRRIEAHVKATRLRYTEQPGLGFSAVAAGRQFS
ncbi:MAG TPA: hypothetical protein VKR57_01235 [Terriglobales bacterium]|jgi:hypothetical protein|nr:hypothetical protein [Terriglobales bacterium]